MYVAIHIIDHSLKCVNIILDFFRSTQGKLEGRNGKRQPFVHDCLSLCVLVCCMKGIR